MLKSKINLVPVEQLEELIASEIEVEDNDDSEILNANEITKGSKRKRSPRNDKQGS